LLGCHPKKSNSQRLVSPGGNVFTNIDRTDAPVLLKNDALLLAVEGDLAVVGDGLLAGRVNVKILLDNLPADHGLIDYSGDIVRLDLLIEDALGPDDDDGALLTEAVTAGDLQFDGSAQLAGAEFLPQSLDEG